MNPIFKEYVVDFVDLKLLGIVCLKCKAEMIFDVTESPMSFPESCPSCRDSFGSIFNEALVAFYKVYKHLTDKNSRVAARIRLRSELKVGEI